MARKLVPEVERRSVLDRALGIFAPVEAGEGRVALLLALDVFLVLGAYYVLKVVREPLILTSGAFGLRGAVLKAAASAAQALLLLLAIPLYSRLAGRARGARLLNLVSASFVACLLGFAALGALDVAIGPAFFVWLGIFNMMAVAQLWSFAADVYTPAQGERLFAIVAFGGTAGAVGGSAAGGWLIARVEPAAILALSALLLGAAMAVTAAIGRLARPRPAPAAPSRTGGFGLVLGRPYLLGIALMVLLFTTVNTNGEFILGSTVIQDARAAFPGDEEAQQRMVGAFYGGFFTVQNVLTALLQLFVVSRVMSRLGVSAALLALPALSLVGSSLIAAAPILAVVRVAKVLENATDYSLNNTARHALFLPVAPDEKYQAKAAIDTFFVRFGDLASFGLVAATAALGLGARAVALVNVVLVVAWGAFALRAGRRYREQVG